MNRLIRERNNALRNLQIIMREMAAVPPNYSLPGVAGNYHPWLPRNLVNRHRAAKRRFMNAHNALIQALGANPMTFILFTHSGNFQAFNPANAAVAQRVRNRSAAIRAGAATVLQKHWRGRKNRMNLTYPKPKSPSLLRRFAASLRLVNNNTKITPNQLAKMNFMIRRYKN